MRHWSLVGDVVEGLLVLPVELLVGVEQLLLLVGVARLHVRQQLNPVGFDVLLHVVALDKSPGKKCKKTIRNRPSQGKAQLELKDT